MADITERKLAEDALRKSEERYRHLIEHAGEAIFVTQDEVFKLINSRLIQNSGFSEQELLGQPIIRFIHPDDAPALIENYRKRVAGSTDLPTHYIFRSLRKDGAIRWAELSVVAITWNDRPAILNFMTDITDRKLSEDALRESEERYRHLIEHAGEGIYVVQGGCLQMANPRTTEMCGYTEQELLGVPFRKFVHPDDYEMLIDRFTRRIRGENPPSSYPFRILRKDGTIRWVELNVGTITWKGAPATLNYVTDIHDRKLAEDALRESEERYREFFRTTLDCVFITSPAGDWIDFNEATVKMFGGSSREEIAQRNVYSFYANPEERDPLFRKIEGMGYIKEAPLRLKKLDGTTFDAVVTSVPLKNPDGSTKAITGTIRDITEIKQAEDALKESEERYRQVFRTTLDGLFITTLEGEWIDFNDAVIGMFGCRNREEVFSIPIRDFYADSKDREAVVQRTLREGYVKEYPLKYRRRDGTTFDALMTVVAWKDPDGSTRKFIGTLRDVSEKKRTEDALKESEERYRQFFRTTLDGLFITRKEGQWIDFNDAIVDLMGYPNRETLSGVPITSVYAQPEERDLFIEQVERDGYVREYPVQMKRRDGSAIYTLMTAALQKNPDGSTKAIIGTIRDVSERKRTEEALRESEDRYRLVTQLVTDFVWDWDIHAGTVRWFGDIDTPLGYAAGEFPRTFDAWEHLLHPDDHDRVMQAIHRSVDNGERFDEEYRMIARDGTIRYFHDRGMVIAGTGGAGSRMLGAVTDITEHRNIEKSLQESEELYRLFFKTSQDSVFIVGTNGRYIDCNDHLFQRLGCSSREEVMAIDTISTYAHPEEREEFLKRVQREGYLKEYPITFRRRDGTDFDTLISIVAQKNPDGTTKAYFGTIRDITEKKRAETAIKESEERYRHIFESFEDLYYQTDMNGIITILSPSLYRLTGYTEDELIGQPVSKIYVNPEDRRFLLDELEKNGHVRDYEVSLRRKDGTEPLTSLSANRIYHADGTPAGVAGILRDITRRKQAEDAMRESEIKFRSLVDYALEAILILDLQGTVLFANNAAAQTVDAENCADLVGRNVMAVIAPESRGDVVKDLEEVARGHDAFLARYNLISMKGRLVSVECIGKAITYEGKPADIISLRDVTGQNP